MALGQPPRPKLLEKTATDKEGKQVVIKEVGFDQREVEAWFEQIHRDWGTTTAAPTVAATTPTTTTVVSGGSTSITNVTGTTWYDGDDIPVTIYNDGDYYLQSNGDLYKQVLSAWELQMNLSSAQRYLRWMGI